MSYKLDPKLLQKIQKDETASNLLFSIPVAPKDDDEALIHLVDQKISKLLQDDPILSSKWGKYRDYLLRSIVEGPHTRRNTISAFLLAGNH